MKRILSILLSALLLMGLVACGQRRSAADDAVRIVGKYKVVLNDNDRKDEYPYMLQTENSVWYLAAADFDLMGEEAFYAGLEDILQYFEADTADARAALSGRIWDEVPPVEIRTDFCGKAGVSQDAGAYYNGRANFIKLFHSWDMAKFALLHEYTHYLTVHCADKKMMQYFYMETVAEYVSKILCENRMLRSVDLYHTEQPQLSSLAQIWGDFDQVKYRNSCFTESDAYAQGRYDGMPYLCVGQYTTYRWANKRLPDHIYELSYAEAMSLALYLIEISSESVFLDNWDVADEDKLAARFLNSFDMLSYPVTDAYEHLTQELLSAWAAWNAQQCEALGLRAELP